MTRDLMEDLRKSLECASSLQPVCWAVIPITAKQWRDMSTGKKSTGADYLGYPVYDREPVPPDPSGGRQ